MPHSYDTPVTPTDSTPSEPSCFLKHTQSYTYRATHRAGRRDAISPHMHTSTRMRCSLALALICGILVSDARTGGCNDACDYAQDAICDDGGTGSVYDDCDLGTDCTDCGPRNPASGGGGPAPPVEGATPVPVPSPPT